VAVTWRHPIIGMAVTDIPCQAPAVRIGLQKDRERQGHLGTEKGFQGVEAPICLVARTTPARCPWRFGLRRPYAWWLLGLGLPAKWGGQATRKSGGLATMGDVAEGA
jgi:hypothetical protein